MAAIPPHLHARSPRRRTSSDPEALYLKREGDHSTVLFYSFSANAPYYRSALHAQQRYFDIQWFEPTYFKLMRAAVDASLVFDSHTGELVLRVPRRSLTGLVKEVVINKVKSTIEDKSLTFVLGPVTAAYLGIVGQLLALRKYIQNRRLLAFGSREKLFREKLKLVAAMVAKGMGGNPWERQLWLLENYDKYESARRDYVDYIRRDLVQRGYHFQTSPTIGPRP